MKLLIKFIVLLAFTLHGAQAGIGGPCGSGLGERLMCHCRRARNCGYLEYYKPGGKIDYNSPHYSGWRSDHPRGTMGGEWDTLSDDRDAYPSFLPRRWARESANTIAPFARFEGSADDYSFDEY